MPLLCPRLVVPGCKLPRRNEFARRVRGVALSKAVVLARIGAAAHPRAAPAFHGTLLLARSVTWCIDATASGRGSLRNVPAPHACRRRHAAGVRVSLRGYRPGFEVRGRVATDDRWASVRREWRRRGAPVHLPVGRRRHVRVEERFVRGARTPGTPRVDTTMIPVEITRFRALWCLPRGLAWLHAIRSRIRSPTRIAFAMIVSDGFTAPDDGKKLASTT